MSKRRSTALFVCLLLFFEAMLIRYGVGIYNDSEQYIAMHIHREPLYPLFLALFIKPFGRSVGLWIAMAVQGILAAFSIWVLVRYLTECFSLSLFGTVILTGIELAPHIITRFVSAMHIFMESSVMSEALCLPLFNLFLFYCLRMLFGDCKKDTIFALLYAFLLAMTRGQMMLAVLLWFVLNLGKLVFEKDLKKVWRPALATILVFLAIGFGTKVYNYCVTGYFIGNTYSKLNILANVMYACDRQDGEVFEENTLEKNFFDLFYNQMETMQANYRFAGDTVQEKTEHLEDMHDKIKFEVLEANLSAYYFSLGKVDYYMQGSMSNEMAGKMLTKLLPVCFGQWFYDYLLLARYGLIRSIAMVHPLINPIAAFIFIFALVCMLLSLRKGIAGKAVAFMSVVFLFVLANAFATSLTIMCLSRYMIYGFAPFYMALFILLSEIWRNRKKIRWKG